MKFINYIINLQIKLDKFLEVNLGKYIEAFLSICCHVFFTLLFFVPFIGIISVSAAMFKYEEAQLRYKKLGIINYDSENKFKTELRHRLEALGSVLLELHAVLLIVYFILINLNLGGV